MTVFCDIKHFLDSNFSKTVGFFVIFYFVGITGMLFPASFPVFVKLIPFALLLSSVALAFFHKNFNTKTLLVFVSIYLCGFFVEVEGVNTGLIFGQYSYGKSLGIKAFNTPLIIGLNWLLLVYITSSVLERTKFHGPVKIFFGATMMLFYDIIIEQTAPKLDMWTWQNQIVPLNNYVAWFIIAAIFHSFIMIFKIKTANKLAPVILVCQVLFFLVLLIYFKLKN